MYLTCLIYEFTIESVVISNTVPYRSVDYRLDALPLFLWCVSDPALMLFGLLSCVWRVHVEIGDVPTSCHSKRVADSRLCGDPSV
mmetsp:Transcript_23525/g.54677  ORF Transcript_23525/g.54677 Transcript_23525/m.54677 type:complete len:85 (+) Transcript_23525:888-1142(+)